MLRLPGVFLRRPLSIHSATERTLSFVYRIAGTGTRNLSALKPGTEVAVTGPLGTGYDLSAAKGKTPLLVAGGTGIASLHFLAEKLPQGGSLFYGARSAKDFVCVSGFRRAGFKVQLATEDGSSGFKGYVTDLLDGYLEKGEAKDPVIYTCGPHPMMHKVAAIARKHGIPCYVSLEEMMACGVGNCQGCAVKMTDGGYKMACKDGPVFDAGKIEW